MQHDRIVAFKIRGENTAPAVPAPRDPQSEFGVAPQMPDRDRGDLKLVFSCTVAIVALGLVLAFLIHLTH